MPNIDQHAPGAFSWFELSTTDQAAAKTFYESLFGWVADDSPMGPNDYYTIFKLGGRDAAAATTMRPEQRAAGVPPNWMIYISVANADASAKLAAELGATVVAPPFDVMTHGRMAVIQDPTGAMFSIWQSMTHVGTRVAGENGTAVWADLNGADQARAGEFYSKLFGWKMLTGKDGAAATPGDYYHIVNGEEFIGGISPDHGAPQGPPHWLMYFAVPNCAAAIEKATSLGGRLLFGPMTQEHRSFAGFMDPQGAVFAIVDSTK